MGFVITEDFYTNIVGILFKKQMCCSSNYKDYRFFFILEHYLDFFPGHHLSFCQYSILTLKWMILNAFGSYCKVLHTPYKLPDSLWGYVLKRVCILVIRRNGPIRKYLSRLQMQSISEHLFWGILICEVTCAEVHFWNGRVLESDHVIVY